MRNNGFNLHEVPFLVHVGDREYTTYFSEQLKIPLVILTRRENKAGVIERNKAPKIGIMGRWCSRVFKIEPIKLFYAKYFTPPEVRIQHELTKKQLLKLLEVQNIHHGSTLKRAKKQKVIDFVMDQFNHGNLTTKHPTQYGLTPLNFQESIWENGEWIKTDETTNHPFQYQREQKGKTLDHVPMERTPINSVVELIGIMKSHSAERAKKNPNVKLKRQVSKPNKEFYMYDHFPIFHFSFKEMKELIAPLNLKPSPYERLYFDGSETSEIRFGCAPCPYKSKAFYQLQKERHPESYYLSRFLLLIASAKNLIEDHRQYWYYRKNKIM